MGVAAVVLAVLTLQIGICLMIRVSVRQAQPLYQDKMRMYCFINSV